MALFKQTAFKQTALYLPWNSCRMWKFVSIACFLHVSIEPWKTTTTPFGLNACLDLTEHEADLHRPSSKMSVSIWILSGPNLEIVIQRVLKINCLQLRGVSQKWRRGNSRGNKWQSPSAEMPCLGWCTGNRLLPARKLSGKHGLDYISPPALRWALLVQRHQGSSFLFTQSQ